MGRAGSRTCRWLRGGRGTRRADGGAAERAGPGAARPLPRSVPRRRNQAPAHQAPRERDRTFIQLKPPLPFLYLPLSLLPRPRPRPFPAVLLFLLPPAPWDVYSGGCVRRGRRRRVSLPRPEELQARTRSPGSGGEKETKCLPGPRRLPRR